MSNNKNTTSPILLLVTMILMVVSLYMAFFYAPREQTMGDVQRIFYFHVPAAWTSFLAFFFVFIYSMVYLAKRDKRWDTFAAAAAEVGILFSTVNIITGPIWAKPVWGVWWTWDARLTLTLVLWLTYVAYLMLRHYVNDPERRAAYSAAIGIVGFIDVPLVYFSIRWWRTQHPQPVIAGGEDSGLDPRMWYTVFVCFATFLCLFAYLWRKRVRLEHMREDELEFDLRREFNLREMSDAELDQLEQYVRTRTGE